MTAPGGGGPEAAFTPQTLAPALREAFVAEAHELLEQMEQGLLALEANQDDTEALHLVFRAAHTLKGNGAAAGLGAVARFTHELESLLEELRGGRLRVTGALVTLLLQSLDELRVMIPAGLAGANSLRTRQEGLMAQLAAAQRGAAWGAWDGADADAVASAAANDDADAGAAEANGGESAARAMGEPEQSLRVGLEKLNRLLTLTGELAIARGRARAELSALGAVAANAVALAEGPVDQLHRELQELVLQLRMVPLHPLLQRQARVVRDLAGQQGKLVDLVVEGAELEVDTAIADHLRDPLTHLVRNAIDHGLEHAATRLAAGKPPAGTVRIAARHEGGSILVEVSDDGAGLQPARILRRAVERGLIAEGSGRLSDDEVTRLLFQPGFSTAEAVTEISGRGVGLDVVRRNVEALRGTIQVRSAEGEGTTFTIRLPLTLAIICGFTVGVGDQRYVIPLDAVVECLALDTPAHLATDGPTEPAGADVYDLRGAPLPCARLRHLFTLHDRPSGRESIVVVQHGDRRAGLVVDALHGESQVVVKSLGAMFHRIAGIAGSTIMGDGRVALILDVPGVLDRAMAATASSTGDPYRSPAGLGATTTSRNGGGTVS